MSLLVRDLMTQNVFTAQSDADIAKIYDIMLEKHIRHVPIVDAQGKLAGIISHRDLVRHILSMQAGELEPHGEEAIRNLKVSRIMRENPKTASPDQDIQSAGKIILDHKLGCLPVVGKDKKLLGIITEADFVKYVISNSK